ncbi:Ig-like domain-containing protein [Parafrigoribacterium soli]|uniref:Ig-like domain-containing protein n=1 Tax=Parafrigoribacterium soli TaxID=3144663 RepID=UPI0032EBC82E
MGSHVPSQSIAGRRRRRRGLHVAAKKFVGSALALTLALTGLTAAFTAASIVNTDAGVHAVAGSPFDCSDPRFFAQAGDANSTTLYEGRYDAEGKSVWTALSNGTVTSTSNNLYNAVAFNPKDSYLYGTTFGTTGVRGKFVRIDQDGGVTNIGTTAAPDALSAKSYSTLWDSGEFDSAGNYYVASGNAGSGSTIYKIAGLSGAPAIAPTLTAIPLVGTVPRYADLTFKAGYLWTASYGVSSTIYRIDINGISSAAGTITAFPVASSILPTASYGSVFSMTNGNLAFIASNAKMYQVAVTDPAAADTTGAGFELVNQVAAPTNAYSDATNCGTALKAGLSATKTGPNTVLPGDSIVWHVTVTNNGPGTSSGFVLTDLLPTGLSNIAAVSTDAGCTVNGTLTITCNGGRLLVGETAKVTVTATAPMVLGSIVNRVKVVGNEDDAPDGIFSAAPTTVGVATSAGEPLTVPPPNGAAATDSTSAEGGTVVLDNGNLVYTPPPGFSGQDSFGYTNSSGDPATMYVTVKPVAGAYAVTTTAETAVTTTAATLLATGTGSDRSLTDASGAVNGTVSLVSGSPVFVPSNGFSGTGSYQYRVTDGSGQTASATVTVVVTPLAADSTATTAAGTAVTVPAVGLVAAGTGSSLALSGVSSPTNGTVSLVSGNPVFVPATGFSGTASFAYDVTDSSGRTSSAIVTVTVAPVAVDVTATASAGVPTTIDVLVVAHGTSLSLASTTGPVHGTATVAADGGLLYTSDTSYSGTDTFAFTIMGDGGSDTGTITVTVTPLAPDDVAVTDAGLPVIIDVLANDTGGLTLIATSAPTRGGTATIVAGRIRYLPRAGFSGIDTFDYTATGAGGATTTATVTVKVVPVIGASGSSGTAKATAGEPAIFDPAADATGSGIALFAVGPASHGVTVVNPDGTLSYTPAAGYSGTDQFTYTLTDAAGQTVTGTLVVTVQLSTPPPPSTVEQPAASTGEQPGPSGVEQSGPSGEEQPLASTVEQLLAFTGAQPLGFAALGLLLLGAGLAAQLLRVAGRRARTITPARHRA